MNRKVKYSLLGYQIFIFHKFNTWINCFNWWTKNFINNNTINDMFLNYKPSKNKIKNFVLMTNIKYWQD